MGKKESKPYKFEKVTFSEEVSTSNKKEEAPPIDPISIYKDTKSYPTIYTSSPITGMIKLKKNRIAVITKDNEIYIYNYENTFELEDIIHSHFYEMVSISELENENIVFCSNSPFLLKDYANSS